MKWCFQKSAQPPMTQHVRNKKEKEMRKQQKTQIRHYIIATPDFKTV
jgi:hypothetical protein